MLKPLLIVVSILVLVILSLLAVQTAYVHYTAYGRPFDHLGDDIKCQKCGAGGAKAGDEYSYHCPTCGANYRARWNEAKKTIEVDW